MTRAAHPRGALRARVAGALAGGAVALGGLLAVQSGVAARRPRRRRSRVRCRAAVSPAGLVERSGVRVVRVAATGGGGLLDLRYQVVDPSAAAAVHDTATPPAIVDEQTGGVIGRLFMGHMPHSRPKAGVTYYLVFDNPGSAVRPGAQVSVVLGDARLEHVLVR